MKAVKPQLPARQVLFALFRCPLFKEDHMLFHVGVELAKAESDVLAGRTFLV
eukprot:GDKH01003560.1.p4 GENE.GDKH01003560.1~~GDKH01003560.1.p4  ORF type:complete len:52 (-),score=4.98 GDKH01003560.1:215-370(-)